MKHRLSLFVGIAIVAVSTVFYIRRSPAGPAYSPPVAGPGEHLVISTSPAEIFRRAFWRHPGTEDVILNAERREWIRAENGSVVRWQWYLALHPSPGLLGALRNPETFDLHPVPEKSVAGIPAAPPWFPSSGGGFEIFQGPSASFRIFYRRDDNALFATDMGQGFAPAQNRRITSANR